MIIFDQIGQLGNWFGSWFSKEEVVIAQFFGPLMAQVKATALQLGKNDLTLGMKILENAAIAAVTAAALAAPGTQVAMAEAAFLEILTTQGIVAIHNAEAGILKAAVAIFQLNHPTANTG